MPAKTRKRRKKAPKFQAPASTLHPGSERERALRAKVTALESELRSLEALAGQRSPFTDSRNRRLAERLTRTLLDLEYAGDPKRSVPISADSSHRRPDSTGDEGASTRWARDLQNRIHRTLTPLLDEYALRVEGRWKPQSSRQEKVRCRNRKCPNQGKRIPRFVGPGGSIELVRCPTCDGSLSPG